jgi:hypothetical protein
MIIATGGPEIWTMQCDVSLPVKKYESIKIKYGIFLNADGNILRK